VNAAPSTKENDMPSRVRTGAHFALAAAFFAIGVSKPAQSAVWYALAVVFLVLGVWRRQQRK